MFMRKKIALAIGFSLANVGVFASDSASNAFENKSFQIRYGNTQKDYRCFAHMDDGPSDPLILVECPAPRALGYNNIVARTLLFYKNGKILPAKTAETQNETCLTTGLDGLVFESCNGESTQQFAFEIEDHTAGSYIIKQDQKCVSVFPDLSKDNIQMMDCDDEQSQELTPRLMTDAIQHIVVNNNSGYQDLQFDFYELDDEFSLWRENLWNIKRGQPQKRLIVDFSSYGVRGRFILKNLPLYHPLYILDNHAGDVTTITMPLTGVEMKSTTASPNVPIMISNASKPTPTPTVPGPSILQHLFRIFNDVADTGFHKEDGTASFTVPEGWILNVFEERDFEDTPVMLTSTSTQFPENIGSIDVIQKAGSAIRMGYNGGELQRPGEITVTAVGSGEDRRPTFLRDNQFIGPVDKTSESESIGSGWIKSYTTTEVPEGEKNGFYIQKTSDSTPPFSDRTTWEPLNIGSWHPGSGQKDELYARDSYTEYASTIWRLKKNGPMACIPDNTESNESWESLGNMKGWFNTISYTGEGLYIYRDRNYGGRKIKVTENVADLCDFNDHMSSFQIPSGWEVRFYTGKNFTGGYYTRERSASYEAALDDNIKSIQILRR